MIVLNIITMEKRARNIRHKTRLGEEHVWLRTSVRRQQVCARKINFLMRAHAILLAVRLYATRSILTVYFCVYTCQKKKNL